MIAWRKILAIIQSRPCLNACQREKIWNAAYSTNSAPITIFSSIQREYERVTVEKNTTANSHQKRNIFFIKRRLYEPY